MSGNVRAKVPIYLPGENTTVVAQAGDCLVCGPHSQVVVAAVGVPVGEIVACPACTRFGARWLRDEVAYRFRSRPGGGAA